MLFRSYNSGFETLPTPTCWHSLATYLHLLDPSQPIESGCRFLGASLAATARRESARALAASVAAASVAPPAVSTSVSGKAITITIKIEMP